MTSDSAQLRGPVTVFADWAIDAGHGEPHQRRQTTVAAGVPASVNTMVKAAARIMALSIRRRHPDGVTPLAQALVTPRTSTTIRATTTAARGQHPHDSGGRHPHHVSARSHHPAHAHHSEQGTTTNTMARLARVHTTVRLGIAPP